MRVCPQCGHSNEDDSTFCVVDGVQLDNDARIRVDLAQSELDEKTRIVERPSTAPLASPAPAASRPALIYGIIGALAASVILLATYIALNRVGVDSGNTVSSETSASPLPGSNGITNSAANQSNRSPERPAPNNSIAGNIADPPQSAASATGPQDADREPKAPARKQGFNGRVIMLNAIIRSAPSMDAYEVGVVGFNQPIRIGKSAGGNNPWYRVTSANGTTGWMHGNTIEFFR